MGCIKVITRGSYGPYHMILLILHLRPWDTGKVASQGPYYVTLWPQIAALGPRACGSTALGRQFPALGRHNVWPWGGKFSSIPRAGVQNYYNIIWVGRYCQNLYNRGRAENFPIHGPGHVTSRAENFPIHGPRAENWKICRPGHRTTRAENWKILRLA